MSKTRQAPPRRRTFYLVQRLTNKRFQRPSDVGFDRLFELEYMGSSEFEWGAVPKALRSMRSQPLTHTEATIHRGDNQQTVHFIGPADSMVEAVFQFQDWADNQRLRTLERTRFDRVFDGTADDYEAETIAWWAIEDDLAWTLDADVAARLLEAFSPPTP